MKESLKKYYLMIMNNRQKVGNWAKKNMLRVAMASMMTMGVAGVASAADQNVYFNIGGEEVYVGRYDADTKILKLNMIGVSYVSDSHASDAGLLYNHDNNGNVSIEGSDGTSTIMRTKDSHINGKDDIILGGWSNNIGVDVPVDYANMSTIINGSNNNVNVSNAIVAASRNVTLSYGVDGTPSNRAAILATKVANIAGIYATSITSEDVNATGNYVTVIGSQKKTTVTGNNVVVLGGKESVVNANDALAFGANSSVNANEGIALGKGASVEEDIVGGVALGAGSVANTAADIEGANPMKVTIKDSDKYAWKSTGAAISVGGGQNAKGEVVYRQITNVAAGTDLTDAVNVAQLNAVADGIDNLHYISVKEDNDTDPEKLDNYDNDGAKARFSIAIGVEAKATNDDIENKNPDQSGGGQIAIGHEALANSDSSIALGEYATTDVGAGNIAIGFQAEAITTTETQSSATAIGANASATDDAASAFGGMANASGHSSTALGYGANATSTQATAVGAGASALAMDSIAIGNGAQVSSAMPAVLGQGIAIGSTANAYGLATTAIGSASNASGVQATALGTTADASSDYATAVGSNATASNLRTVAVGNFATASGNQSTALGYHAQAQTSASTALGGATNVEANYGTAVGYNSKVESTAVRGVALGNASIANTAGGIAGANPMGVTIKENEQYAWTSTAGAVSVGGGSYKGSDGNQVTVYRQITNVAAGTELTDAVNVAQLNALKEYVDQIKYTGVVNPESAAQEGEAESGDLNNNASSNVNTNEVSGTSTNGTGAANSSATSLTDVINDGSGKTVNTIQVEVNNADGPVVGSMTVTAKGEEDGNEASVTFNDTDTQYSAGQGIVITEDNEIKAGTTTVSKSDDGKELTITTVDAAGTSNQVTFNDTDTKYNAAAGSAIRVNGTDISVEVDGTTVQVVDGKLSAAIPTPPQPFSDKDVSFTGDNAVAVNPLNGNTNIIGGVKEADLADAPNIGVVGTAANNTLTIKLAKNVDLGPDGSVKTGITTVGKDSVTVGTRVSVTEQGFVIDGGAKVTVDGVDAGNKRVVNVANGVDENDAATVGQLTKVKAGKNVKVEETKGANGENIYTVSADVDETVINNKIKNVENRLNDRVNKVGARAAALAALHPLDFDPDDKLTFSAGYGRYKGENAGAIGAFYRPDEKVMFSIAGTVAERDTMINAGVSFSLDRTPRQTTTKTAMAKEILELRNQVNELKALVMQMAGKTVDAEMFPDVPENHWAYQYIDDLQKRGIIEGYPDGNFSGDRQCTRYEFAAMLDRALKAGQIVPQALMEEFKPELSRFRVDRIAGADDSKNKIERVRVNGGVEKDHYGSKLVAVSK